jgi:hypothetical protein
MGKLRIIAALLLLSPSLGWGWGREGHRIIAMVAEQHLSPAANVMVQSLLGNKRLDSIASWADDLREKHPETGPWHYVNIPLGGRYDARRDCPPPRSCVVEKITEFSLVLRDKTASRRERAEALKFIVHFVGDIHQPLHTVGEEQDGNDIRVRFLGHSLCGPYDCNLHGVWDTSMILHAGLRTDEYAERLEELIEQQHLAAQSGGTPEQWANEATKMARSAWVRDGTDLDEEYYRREIIVVNWQLARAGLRLAKLLNDASGN